MSWATRELPDPLYDPLTIAREASAPLDDYVAVAFVGHGAGSNFLSYQLVLGQLALFAQVPWGNACGDPASDRQELRTAFDAITNLIEAYLARPVTRPVTRLLIISASVKQIDLCTWVTLDGQPVFEFDLPRSMSNDALARAQIALGLVPSSAAAAHVALGVELTWRAVGEVSIQGGVLTFPADFARVPGLYRFRLVGETTRTYVGEASDLRRRADHYRLGHPSGVTNRRINALLRDHLGRGGAVYADLALDGLLRRGSRIEGIDLRRKAHRLLAEAAALALEDPETSINLSWFEPAE